jgi:hypothetical protein
MPTEAQQTAPDPSAQVRELLKFLREENDAARKVVLEDSEATRKLLKHSLWVVAIPLTIAIGVTGFLGIRSISDIRNAIQTEADRQTQAEIVRMQSEIRGTLADKFKGPNIQQLVKDVAKDETVTAARPLIKQEVASQVKLGVAAERGTIQRAVVAETKSAVTEMNPRIETLVKNAVQGEVTARVNPVVDEVKSLQEEQKISLLISRANADDGAAFDKLIQMWNQLVAPEQQERKQSVTLALQSILKAHDLHGGIYMGKTFRQPIPDDQLSLILSHPDAGMRQAALDRYYDLPKKAEVEERIFAIALRDPSLSVRAAAYRVINRWEEQDLTALVRDALVQWWTKKRSKAAPNN